MPSDDLRERAFEYARQALQARRLAQRQTRESERKAMEAYAVELSERALALMARASWTVTNNGNDLILRSVETLQASKPRYP